MQLLEKLKPNKQLLKVMSVNSLSIVVRLVTGFILSKCIALFIGPQGLGIVGNLRSFLSSIQTLASMGLYNGLIKYVAEHKNDKKELSKVLSTAFCFGFMAMFSVSIVLFVFAEYWSLQILNTIEYSNVIRILGVGVFFYITNYFCLAIINGFGKYKVYTLINIVTTIFSLLLSVFLIWKHQIEGLLYSIVISPAIALFITLILIYKQRNFVKLLTASIDWGYFKKLLEYSIMAIVTALIIPPTLIAIRNHIVSVDGLTKMGYWEAMNRISNYYLVFITSLLSLYLFPKLSEARSNLDARKVIFSFYKTLMPLVVLGLIVLYLFRFYVIKILYTSSFVLMEELFSWQLIGDLFRILSAVLAYQFMAKKMTKGYIITEILSAIVWYTSSIILINKYGYKGAAMGYLVCYGIYFFMLLFLFRKPLLRSN